MAIKQYRKKPVIIEAIQWNGNNYGELMNGFDYPSKITANPFQDDQLVIRTLEGMMTAEIGDWIIKGVKGEFYPCKSDIFNITYEEVNESRS